MDSRTHHKRVSKKITILDGNPNGDSATFDGYLERLSRDAFILAINLENTK